MSSNYTCFDRCKSTSLLRKGLSCTRPESIQNDELDQSSFNVNLQDVSMEKNIDPNDSFDDINIEVEIPSERQKVESEISAT